MGKRATSITLDAIDRKLISVLRTDARSSYTDIAAKLNISRVRARRKLQRLIDNNLISMVVNVDPSAVSSMTRVLLGISVRRGNTMDVGNMLILYPCILVVATTSGRYDISAWAYFNNNQHLLDFICNELGSIPDIINVETTVILEGFKSPGMKSDLNYFQYTEESQQHEIDDLGVSIIHELKFDPRISILSLSKKLGLSSGTIQRKVRFLFDNQIIRVITDANAFQIGYYNIGAIFYVRVNPGKLREAVRHIAGFKAVKSLHAISGEFTLFLWAYFKNYEDMHNFMVKELNTTPGVSGCESSIVTKMLIPSPSAALAARNNAPKIDHLVGPIIMGIANQV